MASGHTGNVVPGNRLWVRVPCPPLLNEAVDVRCLRPVSCDLSVITNFPSVHILRTIRVPYPLRS
jgi:hypothetical protein